MKKCVGTKIQNMATIGSMFADGNIQVCINGDWDYRIHVSEIIKMVNEFTFEVEEKKKYKYLINPELVEDNA